MDPTQEVFFDGWTLCRQSGELLRNGSRIRLQSQPLQILEELLAHPGELVTREQLIARLWPKGVVDYDTALNSAVRRLRTALGDRAEAPRYIETIPRRGYRFIGRLDARVAAPAATMDPPRTHSRVVPTRALGWIFAAAVSLVMALAASWLWPRGDDSGGQTAATEAPGSQAQERLLRARFLFQRRLPGDMQRAQQYFEEALGFDPGLAPAWAGLAGVFWIETVTGRLPPEQGLSKTRDAAERALALDPGLAEAHLRLANYRWSVGDREQGDEHVRTAIALAPENPLVLGYSAGIVAGQGRLDEAIELQQRAVAAEPVSTLSRYNLASFLYLAGRFDESKQQLLKLLELNPGSNLAPQLLCRLSILERGFDEALELLGSLPDAASRNACLSLAYHGLGRVEDSDAAVLALMESPATGDPILIAEVYAYRGEPDLAFRWLQLAAGMFHDEPWLQPNRYELLITLHSPFLKPLHSDPRWKSWIATVQGLKRAPTLARLG
jgi:DNA-binding winged helix-turn-helix (wHTH) protein/tetratricopeptide (TPR) repeat protein